jgi:hypothetical protein
MNAAALTIIGPSETIPARSDADSLIHMIERVARDPSADMAKLERLMDMSQTIREREAERAFNEAMASVQSKTRAVAADANNPQTHSKYATYFALDKAIRATYSSAGFGLSFNTEDGAAQDHVRVVCYVTHGSHTRKYHVDMPADGKGAKGGDVMTKTHAVGAAMTYGQRYLLKMIFNMAIGDDDDGNAAGNRETISEEQATALLAKIEAVGANYALFLQHFKIADLAELPKAKHQNAIDALNAKVKK